MVDDLLVAVIKSAGNEGNAGLKEKKLTVPADAYNIIVVGNVDDGSTVDRGDDVINPSSSAGPTYDGRDKPDVCAPGTQISTTLTNGNYGHNLAIGGRAITGTSFAAPHVAGAVALLMDAWIPNPLLIKTLLINTADDQINAGDTDGWDKRYGWGYISLERAYDERWNYKGSTMSQGERVWLTGQFNPGHTATLAWSRDVDYVFPNSAAPNNLSNLDLYLYNNQGTQLDSSTSTIDNVEQVQYGGSAAATVWLKVHAITVPSNINGTGLEGWVLHTNGDTEFQIVNSPAWAAPAISSIVADLTAPADLGQNFPNPFNPDTWIPYAISKEASVTIQIFNSSGEAVRTLALGEQGARQVFQSGHRGLLGRS